MELFGSSVFIEEGATRSWYAQAGPWNCTCGHCRNFRTLAARRQLPPEVLEILDRYGIPPEKATYVCELYTDEEGVHYQFSYRIAGHLLEEKQIPEQVGHCCHETYPYGAPNFPEPHFDLEVFLTLPWVLEEEP